MKGGADPADTVLSLCWRHFSPERLRGCASLAPVPPPPPQAVQSTDNPSDQHRRSASTRSDLLLEPMAERQTSRVSWLLPQALSEALFDSVNQSLFARRAQVLGERLFLIYKFQPWKFYKC